MVTRWVFGRDPDHGEYRSRKAAVDACLHHHRAAGDRS